MFFKIKIWFDRLIIKFLRLLNGQGFTFPTMEPKDKYMYDYCKAIAENRSGSTVYQYEQKLEKLQTKYPKATRKDVALAYIEAMEMVYGKDI